MTGAQSLLPAPGGLTADQQQQLFSIQLRQLDNELKQKENEQNLRIKQMEEEHAVKMQALRSTLRGAGGSEQLELEGELKPEVLEVSKSLPGISRTLLSSILDAKLDPYNLYKLRVIHSDDSNDKQRFSIDANGDLKLEKAKGKLRDFGSTSFIWNQAFINYTIAITIFFQKTHPGLPAAMLSFSQRILELNEVYIWSDAVLPLALAHHSDVMAVGQTEAAAWVIPQLLIDKMCRPDTVRRRTESGTGAGKRRANTATTGHACDNWNQGKCQYTNCRRPHQCSNCAGDHMINNCPTKKK